MSPDNADTNQVLRVLVVDPLEETRAVLETMLRRRGMEIVTTPRREEGLRLAREFQPHVVVLDCETSPVEHGGDSAAAGQPFVAASPQAPPSLVLIGSARRVPVGESTRYLQKPYDYGPLVHTIEELLSVRRAA